MLCSSSPSIPCLLPICKPALCARLIGILSSSILEAQPFHWQWIFILNVRCKWSCKFTEPWQHCCACKSQPSTSNKPQNDRKPIRHENTCRSKLVLPPWEIVQSYYKSSSVCLFVCLSVCSLSPPRSFDRSSPNLVGVCRWTSELPLRGSFSKRSTGRRVTFAFHYIIYMPASLHTAAKGDFAATTSN